MEMTILFDLLYRKVRFLYKMGAKAIALMHELKRNHGFS